MKQVVHVLQAFVRKQSFSFLWLIATFLADGDPASALCLSLPLLTCIAADHDSLDGGGEELGNLDCSYVI
jgi:hypothetical protein